MSKMADLLRIQCVSLQKELDQALTTLLQHPAPRSVLMVDTSKTGADGGQVHPYAMYALEQSVCRQCCLCPLLTDVHFLPWPFAMPLWCIVNSMQYHAMR